MHAMTIRDLKNNPSNLTKYLENNQPVFITKHGKPIGITLPINEEMLDMGLKDIFYFNLYKQGEISFGKLAEFLKTDKNNLRKMFISMNMDVIDYDPKDIEKELKTIEKYL